MATLLQRDVNYCFFPDSYYTGGKLTGFTNSKVCMVGTKKYIFIVPIMDMTSFIIASHIKKYNWGDGQTVVQGVERMLAEPGMTVEQLEENLKDLLGADDHDRVIEVAQLAQFKVHMLWILTQARAKHKLGGATKVITCKGAGNMKKFKEFYFPKLVV
jgi:hypothetical protein